MKSLPWRIRAVRDCGERAAFAEEDPLPGRMALLRGPALRLRAEPADVSLERHFAQLVD